LLRYWCHRYQHCGGCGGDGAVVVAAAAAVAAVAVAMWYLSIPVVRGLVNKSKVVIA